MSDDVLYDGSGNQVAQASGDSDGASGGDPIGFVMTSTGTVTVERADGTVEQLGAGDPVFENDVLTTADDSTVGIRFQDESRFSLGEEGRMELDTFVYDAVAGTGTSLIDVAEGSFAFVSGMIAKTGDDAMSVQTPVATIGVRGTTVAGDVGPDGQTEVTLLPDTDGTLGEIAVFNQSGLQIMFDAFQRVDIGGSDIAPTAPRTIEPSELRADIADTVRAIGADPSGGRSRPDNEEDGGGADAVEEAAADQAGQADEIDTVEAETVAGVDIIEGLDIVEEDDLSLAEPDLSDDDLAALEETEMDRAADEVAEIDVSAGGDRAIVRMADGTEIEISASELTAGKFVGPSGTIIDLDISLFDSTRIHDRARTRPDDDEEDEGGVRDTPNTFQNETIAADLETSAANLSESEEQALPVPEPELQPLQNSEDEDDNDAPDEEAEAEDDDDEDDNDSSGISVAASENDDDDEEDSIGTSVTASENDDDDNDDDDEDGSSESPQVQTLDDLNDPLDSVVGGSEQLLTGGSSENDDDDDAPDDEDDDEVFNLAEPTQIPEVLGEENPLDDSDDAPPFDGDDLPEDSTAASPLTVDNGLSFGGDTPEDDDEDNDDGDGALEDDGDALDEEEVDSDDSSLMEQLNLGETVDDTQNLLDNFLHPEESDSDDQSDNDNDDDDVDDGAATNDDAAAVLGGVFSGVFGGNDDPPDDGSNVI